MKVSHILIILISLNIFQPSLVHSQNLDSLTLIAHYPLLNSPNDTTGNYGPMTLLNTPFQDGGIYCNGNNPGNDPDPCDAETPEISKFNFKSFAVSAMFKIDDPPDLRRPIFVCGDHYKWSCGIIIPDSTVAFGFGNKFYAVESTEIKFTLGSWNEMTFTYDSTEGMGRMYFNGVLADSEAFQLDHHDDRTFSIEQGSVGRTFKGVLKDLKIYSKINQLKQDSLALVALYNSTDGTNWTVNTNWLTGPVNTWHGITVIDERVTSIDLSNNNLNGQIPVEIGDLDSLQFLYLYQNNLSDTIPSEIGNCHRLYRLQLNSNQLNGSIPPEIGQLDNLTRLYLNYNQLEGSIPSEIGNLSQLTHCTLNNNQLTGAIPSEIGYLTNLESLSLQSNQLTDSIPSELGWLTSLTCLQLTSNQLSGSIPIELGDLTNMMILELGYNQLTGSIPGEIGQLTKLIRFMVNDNNLSGTLADEIWDLTDLTALRLEKNGFEGIIPADVTNLADLELFWLYENQFTDLPDLSSISSLIDCQIQHNRFTFEDIEPNIGIPNFGYSPQDSVGSSQDTTVTVGSSLTLTITVGGANNRYQWKKNNNPITGATDSDYIIDPVSFTDASIYRCDISNTVATELILYSRPVTVTVEDQSGLEQDSLALVALYNSTDGANWTDNTNWLTGPVSTWFGITVYNDRVIQIDLDYNQLTGNIPSEIGNLEKLDKLYLFSNQLSDSIPPEIGNLIQLIRLNLHTNQLSGSIPSEMSHLTLLEYCYLSNNQLTGSIPTEMNHLTHLKRLSFGSNNLSGSVPFHHDSLANLDQLELENNQFDDLPDLSLIAPLTLLDVRDNRLTFEDIEPNIGIADFQYAPQDSVGEKKDTTVTEGQNLTLACDVGGTANQYQWMKDNVTISGANQSTYSMKPVSLSDAGVYSCQITNTIAPDLTLYSRPVQVHVTPGTGVADRSGALPSQFALLQNYPNPFNPETTIEYHLVQPSEVKLIVYDVRGQVIETLVQGNKPAGIYKVIWNTQNNNMATGIFLVRIDVRNRENGKIRFVDIKKMVLIK